MLISEKWSQCDRLVTNGDTYSKNRSKHPRYIVQYGILSETVALKANKKTLDSRKIVGVRKRNAKPAFSSNGNVLTVAVAVGRSRKSELKLELEATCGRNYK